MYHRKKEGIKHIIIVPMAQTTNTKIASLYSFFIFTHLPNFYNKLQL